MSTMQTDSETPVVGDSLRSPTEPQERVAIEVFFDGDCPLCRREIGMLRWLDRKQRIRFTDITAEDFDAAAIGRTHDELMAEIHGRLPNGQLITGVEVFRQLYGAVGLRWLMWITRLPLVSHVLNWGYGVFARNRLRWTGRKVQHGQACSIEPRGSAAAPS